MRYPNSSNFTSTSHRPCSAGDAQQVNPKIIETAPRITRRALRLSAQLSGDVRVPAAGMALPRLALSSGRIYRSGRDPEERHLT